MAPMEDTATAAAALIFIDLEEVVVWLNVMFDETQYASGFGPPRECKLKEPLASDASLMRTKLPHIATSTDRAGSSAFLKLPPRWRCRVCGRNCCPRLPPPC